MTSLLQGLKYFSNICSSISLLQSLFQKSKEDTRYSHFQETDKEIDGLELNRKQGSAPQMAISKAHSADSELSDGTSLRSVVVNDLSDLQYDVNVS